MGISSGMSDWFFKGLTDLVVGNECRGGEVVLFCVTKADLIIVAVENKGVYELF